jgi:hypothetical protein
MKALRSLALPIVFLVVGGVVVGLGGKFVDASKAFSWFKEEVNSLLPWLSGDAVSGSDYVAVYVSGGKVYVGKLRDARSDSPFLTDVFFLSVSQQSPATAPESPDDADSATVEPAQQLDYELVKLTDQLQKPSDKLILSRDQILFWEPLRDDSRVVQAIGKYHEQEPSNRLTD